MDHHQREHKTLCSSNTYYRFVFFFHLFLILLKSVTEEWLCYFMQAFAVQINVTALSETRKHNWHQIVLLTLATSSNGYTLFFFKSIDPATYLLPPVLLLFQLQFRGQLRWSSGFPHPLLLWLSLALCACPENPKCWSNPTLHIRFTRSMQLNMSGKKWNHAIWLRSKFMSVAYTSVSSTRSCFLLLLGT